MFRVTRNRFSRRWRGTALPLVAAGLMAQAGLFAQVGAPRSSGSIRILILQGFGAINYLKTHQTVVPVVSVLDENDRPVEGATVVFDLPTTGPGASFEGGRFSLTTATNAQGQAAASGFRTNEQAGQFTVQVAAVWNSERAHASFTQLNSLKETPIVTTQVSPRAGKSSKKWWIVAAVVAAGAAGGGYYAVSHGGAAAVKTTTITVTPGSISVGAP